MAALIKVEIVALAAMLGCYKIAALWGATPTMAGIAALAGIFGATGIVWASWTSAVSITAFPTWMIGLYAQTGRHVTAVSIAVMSAVVAAGLALLAVATARDLRVKYFWVLAVLLIQGAAIEATLALDSPYPTLAGIVALFLIGQGHAGERKERHER
jgi:hypothetical protein